MTYIFFYIYVVEFWLPSMHPHKRNIHKMTTWSYFLFLALAWSFIIIAIAFEKHDNHLAVVHVINALPNNSEPMRIQCTSPRTDTNLGEYTLYVGDDYQWNVTHKSLHYCEALWERRFASWHAFQPRRDVSHGTVYWLVKHNGFFLSWNNSSWVRKESWQTE